MSAMLTLTGGTVRRAGRAILDAVDFSVGPGEIVGVVGPNGAGKTTLLRAGLGLQPLSGGSATLGGSAPNRLSPAQLARQVGYLPQERRLAWNLSAWRTASLGAPDLAPERAREVAMAALGRVGLDHLAERGVFDMSGGERARVLLARLFATRAPLLLADEPTASLDPDAQLMTLELLRAEAARGGGVVVTLHDLGLAARACDRLVVLEEGRVAADGPPEQALSAEVLGRVFNLEGGLIQTPAGLALAARRRPHAA